MPGFTREAVQQQLTGAFASLDDTLIENLKSQSMLLVQLEYEAQGIAHGVQTVSYTHLDDPQRDRLVL